MFWGGAYVSIFLMQQHCWIGPDRVVVSKIANITIVSLVWLMHPSS